jgi:hypothetical protein
MGLQSIKKSIIHDTAKVGAKHQSINQPINLFYDYILNMLKCGKIISGLDDSAQVFSFRDLNTYYKYILISQ